MRVAVIKTIFLCGVLTLLPHLGRGEASAQDTAAEEAPRRAMVIAQLPPDAAKVLFGRESTPAAGPPQAIGSYERGCLSGAIALPADGPNWQVMRPSRNRAWGHPVLIAFLERLAQATRTTVRASPAPQAEVPAAAQTPDTVPPNADAARTYPLEEQK